MSSSDENDEFHDAQANLKPSRSNALFDRQDDESRRAVEAAFPDRFNHQSKEEYERFLVRQRLQAAREAIERKNSLEIADISSDSMSESGSTARSKRTRGDVVGSSCSLGKVTAATPDLVLCSTARNESHSSKSSPETPPPVAPPRRKRRSNNPMNSLPLAYVVISTIKEDGTSTFDDSDLERSIRMIEDQIKSELPSDRHPSIRRSGIYRELSLSRRYSSLQSQREHGSPVVEDKGYHSLPKNYKEPGARDEDEREPKPLENIPPAINLTWEDVQRLVMKGLSVTGRNMTEEEVLKKVMVLNLDTGERVPLSDAEERLPKCLNPLSLHIMRITSEYCSSTRPESPREMEVEDEKGSGSTAVDAVKVRHINLKLKQLFGKRLPTVPRQLETSEQPGSARSSFMRPESSQDGTDSPGEESVYVKSEVKIRASKSSKGTGFLESLHLVQELTGTHKGAVWAMKFSHCGRLLATAGQDRLLRVWILRDAFDYFNGMRTKYNRGESNSSWPQRSPSDEECSPGSNEGPFCSRPFCVYEGHSADLLDISWSRNYFVLSSSMDKTVRLWHISRGECLCCFKHIDFVTAICFHPKDDRFFLSGSLDGKLRLWNIPEKRVTHWNEVDGASKLITAANFCLKGRMAAVGTYDGRCILYTTDQLKYYTQIDVRSTRRSSAKGRKVTGIESMPGHDKILVSSNDSRIRLYDLRDLSLVCKYKGAVNNSSQIKASFNHSGRFLLCGSEDRCVYVWPTQPPQSFTSRRDKNNCWEAVKAHDAVVTSAIFAPNPSAMIAQLVQKDPALQREFPEMCQMLAAEASSKERDQDKNGHVMTDSGSSSLTKRKKSYLKLKTDDWGDVFVSADFNGAIKVFVNLQRRPPDVEL